MSKKASNNKLQATGVAPKTEARSLTVRSIAVEKINPAPYNPRKDLKPSDPEYQKIKRSLAEFSCVEPLVWNERSGNLVGGHQRLKVMVNEFKAKTIQVSVVDLDDHGEKRLNLALNKIGGEWDQDRLAELLTDLRDAEADLSASGFEDLEVQAMIESSTRLTELKVLPPPVMSWVLIGIPTTRFGEIAHVVELAASLDGVICETAVNNGPKD